MNSNKTLDHLHSRSTFFHVFINSLKFGAKEGGVPVQCVAGRSGAQLQGLCRGTSDRRFGLENFSAPAHPHAFSNTHGGSVHPRPIPHDGMENLVKRVGKGEEFCRSAGKAATA